MDKLWRSNSSISSRTSCPPDIVNDEGHNVEKQSAFVLMCLHDTRSKNFNDKIFGITNVSLNDDPVYFNYYSKASFPYSKTTSKEKGDDKSVDSSFDYVKQLRVLTVLN